MGNESDGGARMEEIGAMIVHAEAAQAALDKGLAAHAENVANITRLIQYGAGVLKKLQAEAEQLGPRAEQAGAGAVREEVRESLAGAGAVVGDAARARSSSGDGRRRGGDRRSASRRHEFSTRRRSGFRTGCWRSWRQLRSAR